MAELRDEWVRRRAAEMRSQQVDAEGLMWLALRRRQFGGYRFRRQHVIGRFIVDFYCAEKRVAVEIDGPTHDWERDEQRDRMLSAAGVRVVRFTNDEVYRDIDGCLVWLLGALRERPSYGRVGDRTRLRRVDRLAQAPDPGPPPL